VAAAKPTSKTAKPRASKRTAAPSRNGAAPSRGGAPKLWGGRFASPTDEMVEAYTSSIDVDERLLPQDVAASIAHARMLGRQRIIPKKDADAIVRGLNQIIDE
jgi:hypothetical protein